MDTGLVVHGTVTAMAEELLVLSPVVGYQSVPVVAEYRRDPLAYPAPLAGAWHAGDRRSRNTSHTGVPPWRDHKPRSVSTHSHSNVCR